MHALLFVLLAFLAVVNFFDYVSTALVISKGRGHEANPVMVFLMGLLGKYWWVSKLVIVLPISAIMLFYAPVVQAVLGVAFLDAIFAYVVVNNYKIAWRL